MTNYRVLALLLALTLAGEMAAAQATAAQGPAKAAPNPFLRLLANGVWWASLPDDAKDAFVDGYSTAMGDAHYLMTGMCKLRTKAIQPKANSEQFNAEVKGVLDLCMIGQEFDFEVGSLRAGVDEFYKEPQNTRIPIRDALSYARDKLKGNKPAQELENQLKDWRNTVNK